MLPSTPEPLTFEQTRGTKTFYFPSKNEQGWPPEVTVMIKRAPDGSLHAGVAVCSPADNFARRVGRRIAFHRLLGRPLVALNSEELVSKLQAYLSELNERRPHTPSYVAQEDVSLLAGVEAAFDVLNENRQARAKALEIEITGC